MIKHTKSVKGKIKPKIKISVAQGAQRTRRRRKLLYKCLHKQEVVRNFLFEKMNEHGAMDNVHKLVPVFELQFGYNPFIRIGELPEVISATFTYTTTNSDVANKYTVGEEYSELPK